MKYVYTSQKHFLLFFLLLISFTAETFAANGKLTGKVVDSKTGEPLIGANVVITHIIQTDGRETALERIMGAATDIDGYYFILNIPSGAYAVKASVIGYAPVVQRPVKVDPDRTVTLDFSLSPTTIEVEAVVVTAKQEVIKQDVSGTQEIITTARIAEMPVTRVDEFVGKVKGVELVSNTEGNGLSFRGGAIRETDVRLDGMSLQDPRSGNSYLSFNSSTINEVQILTGGFEAKYGGIRSGILNVITKEGQRNRFNVTLKMDAAPAQKKFFGTNPWSNESIIYQVYAGRYAWTGIQTAEDSAAVPVILQGFKGWKNEKTGDLGRLDSVQRKELWELQHPQYNIGDNWSKFKEWDKYYEGAISGPVPGESIPVFGEFAKRSTFLLGFKYEDSQLAFPVGPRENYVDWNGQLKITTQLQSTMRLSVNGLLANINTLSGGAAAGYGGVVVDNASSFGFLNSTESSVIRQAAMISGNNITQLFNKSRLQYYDSRMFAGGARFTHTLSDKAYYTIDFNMGYSDQTMSPFAMDTTNLDQMAIFKVWNRDSTVSRDYKWFLPQYGSPNASTNFINDALDIFRVAGGAQRVDSSYSYSYQLKGDLTMQLGRHNQLETGFSAKFDDLFVYNGTWFQSQVAYTPDTWQYYKATPLEIGLYAQDKLEYEGIIMKLGLRLEYFNPMRSSYQTGFPVDEDYKALYNEIYPYLPGDAMSYERWLAYRELLANPTGWPETGNKVQVNLSPRLGVSFPVTEFSKFYFNYGHFYQKAPILMLYNTVIYPSSVSVPSPDLLMGKTVQYEFGFEQMLFEEYLFNATAYYKDITNEPMARTFRNYYEDNFVTKYFPDRYRDIRGVEVRFERPLGRFFTFSAMYDYMLVSAGTAGLSAVYEDRVVARIRELYNPNISSSEPMPRANVNLNLKTPKGFGPELGGYHMLEDLYANLFFEWRDMGRFLLNGEEPNERLRNYVDIVNYWNLDLRASKTFATSYGSLEFVVTVKNLTNNKFLRYGNMSTSEFSDYKNSLKTPDKGGSDMIGEYPTAKNGKDYIVMPEFDAPLFLNPRRVIFGVRLNL